MRRLSVRERRISAVEEENEQLERRLYQSQKLEMIGELAAGISHVSELLHEMQRINVHATDSYLPSGSDGGPEPNHRSLCVPDPNSKQARQA